MAATPAQPLAPVASTEPVRAAPAFAAQVEALRTFFGKGFGATECGLDEAIQRMCASMGIENGDSPLPERVQALLDAAGLETGQSYAAAQPEVARILAPEDCGNSLPLGRTPDPKLRRALAAHAARPAPKPIVDLRAAKIRQHQAAQESYSLHADHVDGATHIGGGMVFTPSMCNLSSPTFFSGIGTSLAAGREPIHLCQNRGLLGKTDFRC